MAHPQNGPQPQTLTSGEEIPQVPAVVAARRALVLYRVMAKVTGATLLIFTLEILLKYAVGSFVDVSAVLRWVWWIPFVHGWVFLVYLVTAVSLWLKLRWPLKRLVGMALAGALPGASFAMEARISRRAERAFDQVEQRFSSSNSHQSL